MTPDEIRFFDDISSSWDGEEILSTPEKVREILHRIHITKGDKILDLGTGTGLLLPYLFELTGSHGEIAAVDASSGMLAKAREKFGHLPNIQFILKDFELEPIDGKWDIVMLYSVYPHIHSPRQILTQLVESNLSERGRLIIAFPTDEHFINRIHSEKKAPSQMLPPAPTLATRFREWGLSAEAIAYDSEHYIIEIRTP